jgi:hypothetical protein
MIKSLPKQALGIIDQYRHLPLGDKLVQCPYFKNSVNVKAGLRVYMGKGLPSELTEEIDVLAKKNKFDLKTMPEPDIKQFMSLNNLGIDCSGLIAQVLSVLDENLIKKIARVKFFKKPLRALISRHRPIENISAHLLTSEPHSEKINKWADLQPGDMIRTRQGKHVLLITETNRNETNQLKEFTYIHSTSYYGEGHGVRQGKVNIIYPNEALKDQEWQEKDQNGKNYSHQGLLEDDGTNGVYRLKGTKLPQN